MYTLKSFFIVLHPYAHFMKVEDLFRFKKKKNGVFAEPKYDFFIREVMPRRRKKR